MKVLMVCLGNICRSPLAHGLLHEKANQLDFVLTVDSAGTSGYHAGEAPDPRMRETAKRYGLNIDDLRARQFTASDFDTFDLIYVMDQSNYENVLALSETDEQRNKVKLILDEISSDSGSEVPDPYFGGDQGFIHVYELLDEATDAIINKLKNNA